MIVELNCIIYPGNSTKYAGCKFLQRKKGKKKTTARVNLDVCSQQHEGHMALNSSSKRANDDASLLSSCDHVRKLSFIMDQGLYHEQVYRPSWSLFLQPLESP